MTEKRDRVGRVCPVCEDAVIDRGQLLGGHEEGAVMLHDGCVVDFAADQVLAGEWDLPGFLELALRQWARDTLGLRPLTVLTAV